jgi:hypothetical protein
VGRVFFNRILRTFCPIWLQSSLSLPPEELGFTTLSHWQVQ